MLTLSNFENQLADVQVKRGKSYFDNGSVTLLDEVEENAWEAEVEGSETYNVEVELNSKGSIKDYFCDCPSDASPCKHIIAVFYALRKAMKTKAENGSKKTAVAMPLNNLLKKISLAEYQEFIQQYAKKNKSFLTAFELHFADKDERIDVAKKYAGLIQKLVKQNSDHGFITYRGGNVLGKELGRMLNDGKAFITKNNFKDAFALAKAVLKEIIAVINESDDSNGSIGSAVSGSIDLLQRISESDKAAIAIKEQLFHFLIGELNDKTYFDYGDYGYEMFDVLEEVAVKVQQPDAFLQFLDTWIAKPAEKYSHSRQEFFKTAKIDFLKKMGRKDEVATLIQQNMDIVEIRQGEVDKAIKKKDYVTAKKLIHEGIKIAEKKEHPGTVSDWEKELLNIARLEKDIEAVRNYTKRFAFHYHSLHTDHYRQWKKTYKPDEWKEVIDEYIRQKTNEIVKEYEKKPKAYRQDANPPLLYDLGPVLVEEQYWDQLLEMLQKENEFQNLQRYHDVLVKRFPKEMLELYLPKLKSKGEMANTRSDYEQLATLMKKLIKDIPESKEKIQAMALEFIRKNPRRPAMVEELGKVLL